MRLTPLRVALGFFLALQLPLAWHTAKAESPVIRAGLETEPTSLDWQAGVGIEDRLLTSMMMRGLFKYEKGKVVCDLCTSYGWSPNGMRLELRINAQVKWSDGKKLTAQDFVLGFKRLTETALKGNPTFGGDILGKIKKFEAVGESILLIETHSIFTSLNHELTRPIFFPLRAEFMENPETGPTLGPFVLAGWEKGKRIVLEANPEYTLPRSLYRVDTSFGSHAALFEKFLQGRLDVLLGLRTEDVLAIKQMKQVAPEQIVVSPTLSTRTLIMGQARSSILKSPESRRMIRLALDVDTLPSALGSGDRASTGLMPPGIKGFRHSRRGSYDIKEAQRLRSLLNNKGEQLISFELLARNESMHRLVVNWLRERLSKIKIVVNPIYEDATQYARRLAAGDFELALHDRHFQTLQPLELLRTFKTGSKDNYTRFTSVTYDAILEQVERTWGQEGSPKGLMHLDEAMDELEEKSSVVVSLSYPSMPFLVGPRVSKFVFTPFGVPDITQIELRR